MRQRSAYPLDLMDRKPASHLGHVVRIVENFGSIRHSISSEPFIHLTSDCLRGGSNLRVPTFLLLKDTRHFPIREWLCLGANFSTRRILSCVLQEQKAPILRGSLGIVGYYLQIQKAQDCMVDQVESEPFSTAEFPCINPICAQTSPISP